MKLAFASKVLHSTIESVNSIERICQSCYSKEWRFYRDVLRWRLDSGRENSIKLPQDIKEHQAFKVRDSLRAADPDHGLPGDIEVACVAIIPIGPLGRRFSSKLRR